MANDLMPRTATIGWASLAEFCADCPLQQECARQSVAEVEACDLVLEQAVEDAGRRRPSLVRNTSMERPWLRIRQAFIEVDPETVSATNPVPRMAGAPWKLEARLAWMALHSGDDD